MIINGFLFVVADFGLIDVHMEGYPFTWFKSLGTIRAVEEKLDRALATEHWLTMFPNVIIKNMPVPGSDHYPIMLIKETGPRIGRSQTRFKFENACSGIKWFQPPPDRSCGGSNRGPPYQICQFGIEITFNISNKILISADGNWIVFAAKFMGNPELAYFAGGQRAKTHWLQDGDLNTKFFHATATSWHKINRILSLADDAGNRVTEAPDICNVARDYFVNIFQKQNNTLQLVIDVINPSISAEGDEQLSMRDWRLIALCNVIYKLLAKVLANRLKGVLDKCISINQYAFVPGRFILDNAMAAIEIVHFMKTKTQESADYSVIVNGSRVGPIVPGRGLRQGDPMSPYLFIICAKGLSALIRQAEARGDIQGAKICINAPIISHLLFADDCFLLFRANNIEAFAMKNILSTYEAASGQSINFQKSEFFCSRNVTQADRDVISNTLGVQSVLGKSKYLGLPSMVGRSKKAIFGFIKDRVWRKINSWSSKCLSKVGREVLIKLWGRSGSQNKGIHWMSWDKMSMHKNAGGMGFKNLTAFNLVMLGKQGWHLMTNQNSLISRLYKAKYYPNNNFLNSTVGHNPSFVWRSICSAKFILRADKLIWRVDPHGQYSVKSAYRLCTQEIIDTSLLSRPGMWHLIWKLHTLPKVKNFLWNSLNIWRHSRFSLDVAAMVDPDRDIATVIFNLLQLLNDTDSALFATVLWSIWKQRNNKIWNKTIDSQNFVLARAEDTLKDWIAVQRVQNRAASAMQSVVVSNWKKPLPSRFKCNIDASCEGTKVGIGMCIRDEVGTFIRAKTECFSPRCEVHVGEAIGLLNALNWVHELHLGPVDFELDSKRVVDSFLSHTSDAIEFGDINKNCKSCFSNFYNDSSVEFIHRQVNEVARNLAKVALFSASP
ncbi:hypothetical protein TSUD_27780 [Trifolium subterraneum]|uniref:Reverse transcriptase domain-containing protein n=1 Tax=Trifolium subterraneum TaxID=3900 RepID=A0A2Z6NZM9_TRISU|nr:hypothetical protein TSUD_27780 [Trifolium subterraneum]